MVDIRHQGRLDIRGRSFLKVARDRIDSAIQDTAGHSKIWAIDGRSYNRFGVNAGNLGQLAPGLEKQGSFSYQGSAFPLLLGEDNCRSLSCDHA